jgi:transcriptional regulator with XRE-family HTH domain
MGRIDHVGVGCRLRHIREVTRIRDREIALALGVGRSAVTESMRGRRGIGAEKLGALADMLGIQGTWLLDGKGREPSKRALRDAAERLMWATEGDR